MLSPRLEALKGRGKTELRMNEHEKVGGNGDVSESCAALKYGANGPSRPRPTGIGAHLVCSSYTLVGFVFHKALGAMRM